MSRIEMVNSQIQKELTHILQTELDDPELGLISIVRVDTTKDLSQTRIFFSTLGGTREKVEFALNKTQKHIRHLLGERMRLRVLPELKFIFDDSIEYSVSIYQKIEEVKNELTRSRKRAKKT